MSKEEAFQKLQEVLVKNYFSNLELLKYADKELFKKIELLSEAINDGLYKEKYELEFIEKDGEFDIYDNINDTYLYNRQPSKHIKKALNSIQFDKKGYFSTLETYFFQEKKNIPYVDKDSLQESSDSELLLLKDIEKYTKILKDDTTSSKKTYKKVEKFIFIGALTGRDILSISKKVKAKNYFVHEPNLELFRLSLFAFDYTVLLSDNATLQFSIMDEQNIFEDKIYQFLTLNNWSNHLIKYYTTGFNTKNSFESILNALITFKPTSFNYNMLLHNVIRNLSQRINKYKMLSFPLDKDLHSFENKPVLYICPGPSLKDNMQWLKENYENFFIVTIGAAYKQLLDNDIKFQAIVSIDSQYEDLNRLQFDKDSCKGIQDKIILASINTDQRILDRFNQDNLFLFDVLYTFKENKESLKGFSVGEIGYRILLELGVKELYLLGTDLAVHQKTGETHSSDSSSGKSKVLNVNNADANNRLEGGNISLRDELIKVKGNFEDIVYTNRVFNNSISFYHSIGTKIKKENQCVYNLCNHGAFFENTIPLDVKDITLSTLNNNTLNLLDLLKNISSQGLKINEKEELNIEKKSIYELLEFINTFLEKDYTSYSLFREDAKLVFDNIMHSTSINKSFIGDIIFNYTAIINPYIDYCINDTKIKKEARKVKEVSFIWFSEIKSYLKEYVRYLENIK